jgi:PAS domain S-box-containing protein
MAERPIGIDRRQSLAPADLPLPRGLFDRAAAGMMILDRTGRILEANATIADVAGHSQPTLRQLDLTTLAHPDDRPSARAWLESLMQTVGAADVAEQRWVRADGSTRWVRVSVVVEEGRSGRRQAIAIVEDISSLKQLEHERDDAIATERHARAEAEQARAAAEQANLATSAFLAHMSHELRTPLNAIAGYVQLLEMEIGGTVADAQRAYLKRIAESQRHLLALVSDILDLASVDAGQMIVSRTPSRVEDAVSAAVGLVRPQADDRGVQLVARPPDPPDTEYVGDEQRVRQIIVNLLSNAVKFTPAGGQITVDVRLDSPGLASTVCVTVADTGVGIPAAHLERIFYPFVQVSPRLTGRSQGTGLGLAISRQLARLMGGDLTVESEPGHGSTFRLWLPTRESLAAGEADATAYPYRELAAGTAHTLGEVGRLLQHDACALIETFLERLRADPLLSAAPALDDTTLMDHYITLITNLGQSLAAIEDAGGFGSGMLRDGGQIQRAIAELHGRQRYQLGWTSDHLRREHALLTEIVTASLQQAPAGARDVVRYLVAEADATSSRAYQMASKTGPAPPRNEPPL